MVARDNFANDLGIRLPCTYIFNQLSTRLPKTNDQQAIGSNVVMQP